MKNRDGYEGFERREGAKSVEEQREKGDEGGARKEMYTCRTREETKDRLVARVISIHEGGNDPADVPSRFASRFASAVVTIERFACFLGLSTPPGSDRRHPSARAHLDSFLSSSLSLRSRGASETNATTQHDDGDNEKEGDDDEKALVGDRLYRLVII